MPKDLPNAFPRPDWTPVEPFPFTTSRQIFSGATVDEGLVGIRYYRKPDGHLAGIASFGPLSEGAPGQAHGGMILTVLDEALGAAAWVRGHPVLTIRLETDFRQRVPVRTELLVETRILDVRHRVVSVEGSLLGLDGSLYARAQGRFLEIDEDAQRRLFGHALAVKPKEALS